LIAPAGSRLFREHDDWLLRDDEGSFVSAGYSWGKKLFALDTTHPQVQEWLIGLMKKALRWGYGYVKLDYLYAGAPPGKRHTGMSR
jgi:alpha-galactosidase